MYFHRLKRPYIYTYFHVSQHSRQLSYVCICMHASLLSCGVLFTHMSLCNFWCFSCQFCSRPSLVYSYRSSLTSHASALFLYTLPICILFLTVFVRFVIQISSLNSFVLISAACTFFTFLPVITMVPNVFLQVVSMHSSKIYISGEFRFSDSNHVVTLFRAATARARPSICPRTPNNPNI